MLNPEFLQILVCPLCKGKLEYRAQQRQLLCRADGLLFAITEDDIPVLLAENAVPLSAANSTANSTADTDAADTDDADTEAVNNGDNADNNNDGNDKTP